MAERFGIYYAPAVSETLWERAAFWLGRDPADGDIFEGPVAGLERDRLLNLTQSASRYGFHATIKAPMALVSGATQDDLTQALTEFAAGAVPVDLGRLQLTDIDGFLALTPTGAAEPIRDFAATVVEDFDPFRAPMTIKDRAARAARGLTPRQEELLDAYGYPYVFEEFFFHMTLTDRLADADRAEIQSAAETWFAATLDEPMRIDRLSLYHEAETGRPFRRIADFKFMGEAL